MGLSHSDRPDYDKLIRILEKGKYKALMYLGSTTKSESLVDRELFAYDPMFLRFSKQLLSVSNKCFFSGMETKTTFVETKSVL